MVVRTTTTWWVLGLGFWVQGFRCFPWLAVNFFLKDGLQVDSSTLQLLQNSANLPMVGKPLYGLVSDAVNISGQHRLPYLALGGDTIPHAKMSGLIPGAHDRPIRILVYLSFNGKQCQPIRLVSSSKL